MLASAKACCLKHEIALPTIGHAIVMTQKKCWKENNSGNEKRCFSKNSYSCDFFSSRSFKTTSAPLPSGVSDSWELQTHKSSADPITRAGTGPKFPGFGVYRVICHELGLSMSNEWPIASGPSGLGYLSFVTGSVIGIHAEPGRALNKPSAFLTIGQSFIE